MEFPIIVFSLLLWVICYSEAKIPKLCNVAYDCSNKESPVWSTSTGKFCEVFRNKCLMLSENCDRVNRNKPEAKKISKKKCQELCRSQMCLTVYKPVCGIYNGKKRTFGNDCEMSRHICQTGETFKLCNQGACLEDKSY